MATKRPYAVAYYVTAVDVWSAKQRGRDVAEGYTLNSRRRYASPAAAWEQADYTTSFQPDHPAYVVDTRTGERVPRPGV